MRRTRAILGLLALAMAIPAIQGMQTAPKPIPTAGKISLKAIDETSGLARSKKDARVVWTHNDSGDAARIFAITPNGEAILPAGASAESYAGIQIVGAKNVDWEDLAIVGDTIYLADVGNNRNDRRDLGVYAIREPDPRRTVATKAEAFYPIEYPDQDTFPPQLRRRFDCEAIFAKGGKLYFVTKHRVGALLPDTGANVYRMDTRFTDRKNRLTKLDGRVDLGGWVTAADVSPDGKTLAILTQAPEQSVWLFDTAAPGDRFFTKGNGRRITFTGAKQCESLTFLDNGTLLIGNEQRDLYRLETKNAVRVD